MRNRHLATALVLLLTACHPRSSDPKVTHAWVRLAAVAGQPAAAYFELHGGRRDERLVRMESALADRTELHESMAGMSGMTTMRPLDHVDLPARATIPFKPGGRHAMLIGLDPQVAPGTAVPLRFGFADGTTTEAEAKTVAAGADAPY